MIIHSINKSQFAKCVTMVHSHPHEIYMLGSWWPSFRISMLSIPRKKYGLLIDSLMHELAMLKFFWWMIRSASYLPSNSFDYLNFISFSNIEPFSQNSSDPVNGVKVFLLASSTAYPLSLLEIPTLPDTRYIHTHIHNWPLQSFSHDYWPSFAHHLCCVC